MATWSNLSLQNAASPLMEQLSFFHDHTMMILIVITIMVSYIMTSLFTNKLINNILENQNIEILWTILPAITLIFIALPSLRLLYLLDESFNPLMSIKAMGHQWYWSYEYMDFTNNMEFDSYLIPYNEMKSFNFRLLEVDNHTVLPMNVQIRLLISSTDVIHSWTIPSLGIKADANPGRLNQLNLLINRPGLFFGQCSEICGANHSFMPITIESVNLNSFIKWIKS